MLCVGCDAPHSCPSSLWLIPSQCWGHRQGQAGSCSCSCRGLPRAPGPRLLVPAHGEPPGTGPWAADRLSAQKALQPQCLLGAPAWVVRAGGQGRCSWACGLGRWHRSPGKHLGATLSSVLQDTAPEWSLLYPQ